MSVPVSTCYRCLSVEKLGLTTLCHEGKWVNVLLTSEVVRVKLEPPEFPHGFTLFGINLVPEKWKQESWSCKWCNPYQSPRPPNTTSFSVPKLLPSLLLTIPEHPSYNWKMNVIKILFCALLTFFINFLPAWKYHRVHHIYWDQNSHGCMCVTKKKKCYVLHSS